MSEYYDPYNFNYTTPMKKGSAGTNTFNEDKPKPVGGFKVFNPTKPVQVFENEKVNKNVVKLNNGNVSIANITNNQFEDLQGNIDLDKNVYAKTNTPGSYDDGEEIPLLEGKKFISDFL